jgi:hypothetical protein
MQARLHTSVTAGTGRAGSSRRSNQSPGRQPSLTTPTIGHCYRLDTSDSSVEPGAFGRLGHGQRCGDGDDVPDLGAGVEHGGDLGAGVEHGGELGVEHGGELGVPGLFRGSSVPCFLLNQRGYGASPAFSLWALWTRWKRELASVNRRRYFPNEAQTSRDRQESQRM